MNYESENYILGNLSSCFTNLFSNCYFSSSYWGWQKTMKTNLISSWLFCQHWSVFFLCRGSLLALPPFELLHSISSSWPVVYRVLLFESGICSFFTTQILVSACYLWSITIWQHPAFALGSFSVNLLLERSFPCVRLSTDSLPCSFPYLARVQQDHLQNFFIGLHHVPSLKCPLWGQWKTDFIEGLWADLYCSHFLFYWFYKAIAPSSLWITY